MERICSQCHAVLAPGNRADWCPACGGALTERPAIEGEASPAAPAAGTTIDHRGVVLPRRHAVGGIISPS